MTLNFLPKTTKKTKRILFQLAETFVKSFIFLQYT